MRFDRSSLLFALLFLLATGGGVRQWLTRAIHHPPGLRVAEAPLQQPPRDTARWVHEGAVFRPLAEYRIRARVLGVRRYRWDTQSALSPLDLALGWGTMSDEAVLRHLTLWQNDRWFRYQSREISLPFEEMQRESANTHLIPATPEVARSLRGIRPGEVVELRGRLVHVEHSEGWSWTSSLVRDDGGDGACELLWVEAVRRHLPL